MGREDEALPEEPKLLITLMSGTKQLQGKTTIYKRFGLGLGVCLFVCCVLVFLIIGFRSEFCSSILKIYLLFTAGISTMKLTILLIICCIFCSLLMEGAN